MAANVSFSKRFENIMSITKSLAEQGQDAIKAKSGATQMEEQFLARSSTAEEYQRLCDDYINEHATISSSLSDGAVNQGTTEEIFNEDGPTFGKYKWATFHADGVTSTIYKAKNTDSAAGDDVVVALKVMRPDLLQAPHNARREVRTLEKARSENVISLLEVFQHPGGQLILVFPFLRQELENLLRSGSLTRKQSAMAFEGLFSALVHLHSQGIIHRDVKPSNILLKSVDGPVYLIDFGIVWAEGDAESEPADKKITDVGTTCYRPPEILFGHKAYDASLDMWAAGCIVAEMVTRNQHQLFDAGPLGSELGLIKSIFSTLGTPTDADWPSAAAYSEWGKFKFHDFSAQPWCKTLPGASETAIDFVRRTVCYETTIRLSAEEALCHPLLEELREGR